MRPDVVKQHSTHLQYANDSKLDIPGRKKRSPLNLLSKIGRTQFRGSKEHLLKLSIAASLMV